MKKAILLLGLFISLTNFLSAGTIQLFTPTDTDIDINCRNSTGTIQNQLNSIATDTGTIRNDLTSVRNSTGTIQTQVNSVAISTGSMVTIDTFQTITSSKEFSSTAKFTNNMVVGTTADTLGALLLTNSGTQIGLRINQDGILASGRYGLHLYSNAAQTTGDALIRVQQANTSSTIPVFDINAKGTGNIAQFNDADLNVDVMVVKDAGVDFIGQIMSSGTIITSTITSLGNLLNITSTTTVKGNLAVQGNISGNGSLLTGILSTGTWTFTMAGDVFVDSTSAEGTIGNYELAPFTMTVFSVQTGVVNFATHSAITSDIVTFTSSTTWTSIFNSTWVATSIPSIPVNTRYSNVISTFTQGPLYVIPKDTWFAMHVKQAGNDANSPAVPGTSLKMNIKYTKFKDE